MHNNILITGGAGFIGSHLCEALLDEGNTVVCADNFQRGSMDNIRPFTGNPLFAFYRTDAGNQDDMEKIIVKHKIDYVFHLAANTDLWESMSDPGLEDECTFLTTKTVLNAMRNTGVKRMFFSSTSVVYGEQKGDAFSEESRLFPVSYYGAAKLASEAYIYAFAHMNDFEVLIYRFSNIIGSRMGHGVIYDFIRRLKEKPDHLDVRGNGFQTKPYLHVSDLIHGIMMLKDSFRGIEIYNIGATTRTNVRHIAELVVHEMGLDGIPVHYEDEELGWKGDIAHYEYNINRIARKGWAWKMDSDTAVLKTVRELVQELQNTPGENSC